MPRLARDIIEVFIGICLAPFWGVASFRKKLSTGRIRPFTWVLFTLFLGSVSTINVLSQPVSSELYFFEIDESQKTISSCRTDDYQISRLLLDLKKDSSQLGQLKWQDGKLVNPTNDSLAGCVLHSKDDSNFKLRCLEFAANSEKFSERILSVFEEKDSCWLDRDLTYVIHIDQLFEKNSLSFYWSRLQNLL